MQTARPAATSLEAGRDPAASDLNRGASQRPLAGRGVATWLFIVAVMIVVMVALGGFTRRDGAGLSIMNWQPVSGTLPPLTEAAWNHLFALYKTIPQYQLLHQDMSLDGFKALFWPEYLHRLWGRLIGLAFAVPLIFFIVTGRIGRRLIPWLVVLWLLGGLQGAIGWFMVASGFDPQSTAVQPWRLTLHFVAAMLLFGAVLWTAFIIRKPVVAPLPEGRSLRRLTMASLGALALTMIAGTFVSGTQAYTVYNKFPMMGAGLVPPDYAALQPFWLNWFANKAAVQFDHRLLATLTAVLVLATVVAALRRALPSAARDAFLAVGALVLLQYVLGVGALTSRLLGLGVWHQVNAVLLLGALLWALSELRGARASRLRSAGLTV